MISERLKQMNLPPLWKESERLLSIPEWELEKKRMLQRLQSECYGLEPQGDWITAGEQIEVTQGTMGGKAVVSQWMVKVCSPDSDKAGQKLEIPVTMLLPEGIERAPIFLWIQFEPKWDSGIKSLEEIIDKGYGIVSCYYQDIAKDEADPGDCPEFMKTMSETSWGTISKWAFGLSRIMDFLLMQDNVDGKRVAIVGGSRLGKAVLWAGAIDHRFSLCAILMSGTGGASLYRENAKETLDHVLENFPHWFCRNYQKYRGKVDELFFDAHFLLALRAPEFSYVCSGSEDPYVDAHGQFLACCAANPAYQIFGTDGLVTADAWPKDSEPLHQGRIGYHVRSGGHFMSRYDFEQLIKYRNQYHI